MLVRGLMFNNRNTEVERMVGSVGRVLREEQ